MKPSVASLASTAVVILLSTLLLQGCSRRQQEWEQARAANTPESYETFLATYPDGEFSAQARARAGELRERRDWDEATAANTLEGYREFVRLHPDGRMSDEARIRIESFALSAPVPESAPGLAALAGPTSIEPANEPVNRPQSSSATSRSASATAKTYRIQLGAFAGGEKQAMNEWRRLREEFPALLEELTPSIRLATTTTGHLYRLQAGMTDEARARSICAALKAESRDCVVVLP